MCPCFDPHASLRSVSDTTPELVLGVDFLKKSQTVISFSESCALVAGEKVRFVSGHELGGLTKGRPH